MSIQIVIAIRAEFFLYRNDGGEDPTRRENTVPNAKSSREESDRSACRMQVITIKIQPMKIHVYLSKGVKK